MRDFLGVAWVIGSGWALVIPALHHGHFFGPYGILSKGGLTNGVHIGSSTQWYNSDLIDEMSPWTNLAWQQVHHGHLPLWNPYSGLGLPLAFNFQSGVFSLPMLVGYLVPMRFAFTVGVFVTLAVAGSGGYFFGRVLGLGVAGATTVGTVYELSGSVASWLGFPIASVASWAGWILGFGFLVIEGRHRAGAMFGLAFSIAFAILAGQPQTLICLAILVGVGLVARTISTNISDRGGLNWRQWLQSLGFLAGASIAGACLAGPVFLPALQLVGNSVKYSQPPEEALVGHTIFYTIFQGYDGLPLRNYSPIGLSFYFYTETTSYVGLATIVLAGLGAVRMWRRAEVRGFLIALFVCIAIIWINPVTRLMDKLPAIGTVEWARALVPLAFILASLAGLGVDQLVRTNSSRIAGV